MRAAAVAAVGMREAMGLRNMAMKKSAAVAMAARPVLPPSATPAEDSTNVVTVEVPQIAPVVVEMAFGKVFTEGFDFSAYVSAHGTADLVVVFITTSLAFCMVDMFDTLGTLYGLSLIHISSPPQRRGPAPRCGNRPHCTPCRPSGGWPPEWSA